MLGEHPIDVVLLAKDLEISKDFYAGKLGLEVAIESEGEIIYKCGGDSLLAVTKAPPVPPTNRHRLSGGSTIWQRSWLSCGPAAWRSRSTTPPS